MKQTFEFDKDGKISGVVKTGEPADLPNPEVVHHCPRCGSYFYGRFEGFDGNPYFCGTCGFTYPEIKVEALREMHRKNGTLEKFDNGEMIEEVGSFDITVQ